MSDLDGYPDDMSDHLTDDQAERLLGGGPTKDIAPSLTGFVAGVRDLGTEPVDDALAAAHVAAAAGAVGNPWSEPAAGRRRRRTGFTLARPAIAAVSALLVLGGFAGLGTVAHAAAPGDPLYGLDRALEAIGIGDGGLSERATEAAAIADTDLGLAMETALAGLGTDSDDLETADRAEAVEALTAAAAAIETRQAPVQDEVGALLRALAEGETEISEIARDIRRAIELPDDAAADPEPGPAEGGPVEEAPGRDRGEPPSDRGPSDTGSENGRVPDELPSDGGSPPGRTP